MLNKTNDKNNKLEPAVTKLQQEDACPDKSEDKSCGNCPGCSGQRKRYSTMYYIIPAIVIIALALILKYFGLI